MELEWFLAGKYLITSSLGVGGGMEAPIGSAYHLCGTSG